MLKRLVVASLFLALSCIGASASDCWSNVAQTQADCGVVNMFLNGSNQAVPASSANPMPSALSGTASNASDGVATSATNVPTVSYNYLWNGTTWDRLPGTVANGSFMQGAVASGVTDSGNPVKVGGKYNAAGISLANGQRGDLQVGAAGSIKTELWMPGVVASNTIFNNSGDGIPNSATAYITVPLNYMYDGTSWIRSRSIVGAIPAGTGTAAVAIAPTAAASAANTITNASSVALEVARAAKASAGNLYGYYCTAVAGAASGFCIGYNATACPANGAAVTAALVLDVCAFDTTNKGCSISRIPGPARNYSAAISVCMTTATSPFGTMVSNVDTGFISVDYQ